MLLTRDPTPLQLILRQAAYKGLDGDLKRSLREALFFEGLIPDPDPAGDLFRILVNELRIPSILNAISNGIAGRSRATRPQEAL